MLSGDFDINRHYLAKRGYYRQVRKPTVFTFPSEDDPAHYAAHPRTQAGTRISKLSRWPQC